MEFVFDNNIPIYIQLVDQLKGYIISGTLSAGERLPSVRELALISKSNPNTVQKALGELENEGLIYTERTNGKFVCEDTDKINRYRQIYAADICDRFLSEMNKLGFSDEQAKNYLLQQKGEQL